METLKFKTTINCGGCIEKVTPLLNAKAGIGKWQVDTANPDKILTVETDGLAPADIMNEVKKGGFKISLLAMLLLVCSIFSLNAHAQGGVSPLAPLLNSYYNLKDALVGSDATLAAAKAGELLNSVKGVDMKTLSDADRKAFMPLQDKLAFDARHISESKDIEHQREHFAQLSLNFYALAKATKMSDAPIYEAYCPMKKDYWLSGDAAIKNPYFGKAMLTCGKVAATLK